MTMHRPLLPFLAAVALFAAPLRAENPAAPPVAPLAAHWTLVGWNDLGMHCMDRSYDLFSILPPYNVIHAQLLHPDGSPVIDPAGEGIAVTYEGVADPDGAINTTSVGKTGFWDHVQAFFGVALAPDQGLAGFDMPGAANAPKSMRWDVAPGWFSAEGIPITPRDDGGRRNAYPLMKLVARGPGGALLAETSIVLPVSDEMSCKACHASGSVAAAEPPSGWANDPDVERDYRANVLRLHDDRHLGEPAFQQALETGGYLAGGLLATANAGTPILCARCHASNALPGTGQPGLSPLTAAVHTLHAGVVDPTNGQTLEAATNRSACYRCHPGSTTKCLRGAMGKAVGADGAMSIQCQACHGAMSRVGAADRVGWLEQPACQSCHTGTATHNNGEIRYASAFDAGGDWRVAVDATFATNPGVPAPGFDLYRFSFGHGGLACEACHGSTHAEYPASHRNDNLQSQALQGHAGVLAECAACHTQSAPAAGLGGPHGLHPIGQAWIQGHQGVAESQPAACRACHGADSRGTVLSLSQADWTASTDFGAKHFWRGFRISCYACHDGPDSEDPSPNHPAAVTDRTLSTASGVPAGLTLTSTDADGDPRTLRVVEQPAHGTIGLMGSVATLFPDPGWNGLDRFTYAAWDGRTDSNLGTVTLRVEFPGCPLESCIFADGLESGDSSRWWLEVP